MPNDILVAMKHQLKPQLPIQSVRHSLKLWIFTHKTCMRLDRQGSASLQPSAKHLALILGRGGACVGAVS
jgi:hypothetical protein